MEKTERCMGIDAIKKTLQKDYAISQAVNYSPRKRYDIDRLHEQADRIILAGRKKYDR